MSDVMKTQNVCTERLTSKLTRNDHFWIRREVNS
jgi:hypothetical protein